MPSSLSRMIGLTSRSMLPENFRTASDARSSSPTNSRFLAPGILRLPGAEPGHPSEEDEVVPGRQLLVEGKLLGADADDLSHLVHLPQE